MKKINIKKLIILNIPYVIVGLVATNIGEAFRIAGGTNASEKLQSVILEGYFGTAFSNPFPSFHPVDLLVGLAIGGILRLAVYMKSKNAKKFRHNQLGQVGDTCRHRTLYGSGVCEQCDPVTDREADDEQSSCTA